ncbi:unnamed protein product, partial [Ectocarpus fasciculatus]
QRLRPVHDALRGEEEPHQRNCQPSRQQRGRRGGAARCQVKGGTGFRSRACEAFFLPPRRLNPDHRKKAFHYGQQGPGGTFFLRAGGWQQGEGPVCHVKQNFGSRLLFRMCRFGQAWPWKGGTP